MLHISLTGKTDDRRQLATLWKIHFPFVSPLCFCAKAAQNAAVSVQGRKEKEPSVNAASPWKRVGLSWGSGVVGACQALLHLTRNISVMAQAWLGP